MDRNEPKRCTRNIHLLRSKGVHGELEKLITKKKNYKNWEILESLCQKMSHAVHVARFSSKLIENINQEY